MFRVTPFIAALTVMLLPLSALADQPARADGRARAGDHQTGLASVGTTRVEATRGILAKGHDGNCPLGLAKKLPSCVPPGLAKKQRPIIGRILGRDRVHVVTRPGLYGLGIPPRGSRYGVVDGQLVRLDASTLRVQSIIRRVNGILD